MQPGRRRERFLASTRGRIIVLLRRASRTVDELAQALGLSGNAIRVHLMALERDGLVQQHGRRASGGKPASTYTLTPEAEALFPKAYAQLLSLVLANVLARHGRTELASVLRTVGQELAHALVPRGAGDALDDRLGLAKRVWGDLGGLAEVRREGERYVLEELSCPLKEVVIECPEACQLALALLQTVLDTTVKYEHDLRGAEPRCKFEVVAG